MSGTPQHFDAIFNPKSVAMIGASKKPGKWGFMIINNIVMGGYKGKLYPVNPGESEIFGMKSYRNIKEIDDSVDLAMIAVPSRLVMQTIDECCEKGVKASVVISAGFSESSEEGKKAEKEIVAKSRSSGMRIVGPNTMGVFSATSSLHALMPPVRPIFGRISFISQSGNIGTQMLALGQKRGIGFNKFVSSGNEADLRCTDFLRYFGDDPETGVIVMYIEGLEDGKEFFDAAKSITKRKPIIFFKSGRTNAGAKAAKSHVGAIAGSTEVYDAMFRQAGVIKASTTDEILDFSAAFAGLPIPKGRRVGIISGGGGWGVVAADACASVGLQVPDLLDDVKKRLDKLLPHYWSRGNPIDLVASVDVKSISGVFSIVPECSNIDGMLMLCTVGVGHLLSANFFGLDDRQMKLLRDIAQEVDVKSAKKIIELIEKTRKPMMIAALSSSSESDGVRILEEHGVPVYNTPERAAKALAKLAEYGEYLRSAD